MSFQNVVEWNKNFSDLSIWEINESNIDTVLSREEVEMISMLCSDFSQKAFDIFEDISCEYNEDIWDVFRHYMQEFLMLNCCLESPDLFEELVCNNSENKKNLQLGYILLHKMQKEKNNPTKIKNFLGILQRKYNSWEIKLDIENMINLFESS